MLDIIKNNQLLHILKNKELNWKNRNLCWKNLWSKIRMCWKVIRIVSVWRKFRKIRCNWRRLRNRFGILIKILKCGVIRKFIWVCILILSTKIYNGWKTNKSKKSLCKKILLMVLLPIFILSLRKRKWLIGSSLLKSNKLIGKSRKRLQKMLDFKNKLEKFVTYKYKNSYKKRKSKFFPAINHYHKWCPRLQTRNHVTQCQLHQLYIYQNQNLCMKYRKSQHQILFTSEYGKNKIS